MQTPGKLFYLNKKKKIKVQKLNLIQFENCAGKLFYYKKNND